MYTYKGKTALVTGASSGIGQIFARELAARGCSLIVVARSAGKLHALAAELRTQHAVLVDVLVADLAQEHAAEQIATQVQELGRTVDILVNNAGFAAYGRFDQVDFAKQHGQAMLNVVAVVDLAHLCLAGMLRRGDGAIINVASVLGYLPTPGSAVYGASKAFVLHFSEALWQECRGRGVRVLALCPGPTKTEFFDVAHMPAPEAIMTSPAYVVQVALRALERDQAAVIAGKANNIMFGLLPRLLPRRVVLWVMGKGYMQPDSAPPAAPTRHRPHLDRPAE